MWIQLALKKVLCKIILPWFQIMPVEKKSENLRPLSKILQNDTIPS